MLISIIIIFMMMIITIFMMIKQICHLQIKCIMLL